MLAQDGANAASKSPLSPRQNWVDIFGSRGNRLACRPTPSTSSSDCPMAGSIWMMALPRGCAIRHGARQDRRPMSGSLMPMRNCCRFEHLDLVKERHGHLVTPLVVGHLGATMTTNEVVELLELILLLVVGATAPSYRPVMWRTFLVWLAALFIAVWITGEVQRDFGDRWLMRPESWVENFGKYLGMLMCSSIAWGVVRWRRRRQTREERRPPASAV